MKMKKFDVAALGKTFLGSILLIFYRTNQLNKWQVVKFYNELSKIIIDNEKTDAEAICNYCKCFMPKNSCIVYSEDGKYSPLATCYIGIDGEKYLLPIDANNPDEDNILTHTDEEHVKVIYS